MKLLKKYRLFFIPIVIAVVVFTGLSLSIPKAEPLIKPTVTTKKTSNMKNKLHYVAIGDSLTEGVGDQTKQGGFVPLIANDLREDYQLKTVETENYGVNGERSDQILKRVKKKETIQSNIETADFITLTVGGNDLMKVIQNNFFGLTTHSFKKPLKDYQENVTKLLAEIRGLNSSAPIYVLGIYNPFYLNFPEITDMQTIVDNWNQGTETIVKETDNCYFIPINDLLYQGLDQKVGVAEEQSNTTDSTAESLNDIKNNVLYEEDHFHPNNLGYQLMANAVKEKLVETKEQWLLKEGEK
ncbi:SGNH/GDSL hydrolase family protein [Enterococcus sp. DIV0660C]|uniref:SGNH/GDSL hydrolase family protein n=1 Tax=Enterococcus sp. DIV0660C TaxID=2230880 RepID=UPI001A8F0728|nr:SGNH/GDSL hydrolase family protein [Enterococcus sp. DIV0660C]MBO0432201.1 SGNH/GDSL hydrolase family protein [Enterococcus sp. DIV0660C]